MIDYKTIGSKIRNQRIACNLSQEKLAELCDELNNAELTYKAEIGNLLEDCSSHELMIITNTIQALKSSPVQVEIYIG